MSTFSTNQARQVYVAKALKGVAGTHVVDTDSVGTVGVIADTAKSHLYLEQIGAGGRVRSDLVTTKNILSAKATDADKMAHKMLRYKLSLDSTVNSGAPVVGQDYVLTVAFKQYIGISPEYQYFKFGTVHAYTGMTASIFYRTLALSLVSNFKREVTKLVTIYLETGGTDPAVAGTLVEVTDSMKASDLTGTYTGIVIEEAPQYWKLGTFQQSFVIFNVLCDTIKTSNDTVRWGVINKLPAANVIDNGKNIADLEYFLMGERGDQYRYIGFPNYIPTTYLVDPSIKYNVIDIQYFYSGDNEAVQKSEKTLTIIVPKVGATNSVSNALTNSIITALNTATGLSISALDSSAT